VPDLASSSDTGISSTDNVTADSTPTIDLTGLASGATACRYCLGSKRTRAQCFR
jgi:hypothetical protein